MGTSPVNKVAFQLSKLAGQNGHFINGAHDHFQGSGWKFFEKIARWEVAHASLKKFKGLKYKEFFYH